MGHHTVPGPGFGVRATPLKPSSGGHPDQLSSSGVTAGFECQDGRSRIFGILGCGRVRLILHCHFCCRRFEQNFAITPSSGETGPFCPVQVAFVGWQPGPPPACGKPCRGPSCRQSDARCPAIRRQLQQVCPRALRRGGRQMLMLGQKQSSFSHGADFQQT